MQFKENFDIDFQKKSYFEIKDKYQAIKKLLVSQFKEKILGNDFT